MSEAKTATPVTDPVHTRAPYWQDVPDEQWMDWRWQMANRLNSVAELEGDQSHRFRAQGVGPARLFRVDITPYFASLIDPGNPHCPVRKR